MEVNGVVEEVLALKSIYFRELEVVNNESTNVPTRISINLHPATADNAEEQYVCLTLVINLPPNYPNDVPEIVIRNPRGLSDEDFERIKNDLHTKANESQGNAMLYELIEIAKEHLTMGNTPRCACAICLYGFNDADVFTKTGCYHYFHSHCLARYVEYVIQAPVSANPLSEQISPDSIKVLCPVCREPITYDLETLKAPPPLQSESAAPFELDSELVKLQEQMSELFDRQKSQGGIIDVEAEKNKYLLEISTVPTDLDVGQVDAVVGQSEIPKSSNNKSNKKDQQSRTRNPAPAVRDDQQHRRPQPESRGYPPNEEGRSSDGRQRYRPNYGPNRGGRGRWNGERGYHNRGGYAGHPRNDRQSYSNLKNSLDGGDPPQDGANRHSDGPYRHPPNLRNDGYGRPNFRHRGRSGGWRNGEADEGGRGRWSSENGGSGNRGRVYEGNRRSLEHGGRGLENEKGPENGGWGSGNGKKGSEQGERTPESGDQGPENSGRGSKNRGRGYEHGRRGPESSEKGSEGSGWELDSTRRSLEVASRPRKMDWAEQVGDDESLPASAPPPPRDRRSYNERSTDDAASKEDDNTSKQNQTSKDSYRKRNNNYRNYGNSGSRRSNRVAEPAEAKAALATGSDKSAANSDSIPVSRFMVLTGPPKKSFTDTANGQAPVSAGPRPPPGFGQPTSNSVMTSLPPGFKSRAQNALPAPPGFEERM